MSEYTGLIQEAREMANGLNARPLEQAIVHDLISAVLYLQGQLAEANQRAGRMEPPAPGCLCSPGDLCSCPCDCECRSRDHHDYAHGHGWRNWGARP